MGYNENMDVTEVAAVEEGFEFDGERIHTLGQIYSVIATKIGSKRMADKFAEAMVTAMGPDRGIYTLGYVCGEFPVAEGDKLLKLFDIPHPLALDAPRTINGLLGQGMQIGEMHAKEKLEEDKYLQIMNRSGDEPEQKKNIEEPRSPILRL